jgi:hypothetical protein
MMSSCGRPSHTTTVPIWVPAGLVLADESQVEDRS